MSSCTCTHIDNYNPCSCGACPTTSTTTTTTIPCIGEPCDETFDPRCVIYNGPNLPCYGITTGMSAADIMAIVISLTVFDQTFDCTFN